MMNLLRRFFKYIAKMAETSTEGSVGASGNVSAIVIKGDKKDA